MDQVRPLAWPVAVSVSFVAAASILVLEIAAGRLLAPYVGVSLTTYTGIIGAILAGIAIGAWLGGRAADRYRAERVLGPTIILGGWAAIAAVPIVTAIGTLGLGDGFVAIVTLATVGFVLPAILLSAVAPMIVRASLTDVATSGAVVGKLSAVGTVGAISGTFLTGFVLLGLVPTRGLIVGVGVLLVLIGFMITWRIGGDRRNAIGLAAGSLVLGAVAVLTPTPCDFESAYFCAAIVVDRDDPEGRYLILDGLTHAYVDLDDPSHLEFGYIRRFADASVGPIQDTPRPVAALHIGGGGFSFPRYLDAAHPDATQTVLELDPRILEIARSELGFKPSERMDVVVGDARRSIERLPTAAFDVVFGDAFGGLAVPWHLTTDEFLAQVERVMVPGGMLAMNLIDGPSLDFVRAEAATLGQRFDHVAVISGAATLEGDAGGNVVLVASDTPIDADAILDRVAAWGEPSRTTILHGDAEIARFVAGAPVLTDDFAPVDQLLGR